MFLALLVEQNKTNLQKECDVGMVRKSKIMKVVKVDWLDVTEIFDIPKTAKINPDKCTTYGEFDSQTKDTYTIIREHKGKECDKQIFIKKMIVKITELKEVK